MSEQDGSENIPEVLPAEVINAIPLPVKVRKKRLPNTKTVDKIAEKHAQIMQMHAANLSNEVIAAKTGMSHHSVRAILKKFENVFKEIENVRDFRTVKAELLAASQLTVLKSAMNPAKLQKASFLSTLSGFEILNKAERLETGKSTENIAHRGRISLGDLSDE